MNSILKPDDYPVIFPGKAQTHDARILLLLGGAASLKHNLLHEAAAAFSAAQTQADLFFSARNPAVLTAVYAPSRKTIIADGNYFNKITMFYPSAAEKIFSLDFCTDTVFLEKNRKTLIRNFDKSDLFSARAAKYQQAASAVKRESAALVLEDADKGKIANYIIRFLTRNRLTAFERRGTVTHRRISAVSLWGIHTDCSGFEPLEKVFVIRDNNGAVSELLLRALCYAVTGCGEDVILFKCALTDMPEHLIIPALHIGFFTENKNHRYPFENKQTIHAKRFIKSEVLPEHRAKLQFNDKLIGAFLDEAVFSLFESEHFLKENDTVIEKSILPEAYTNLCRQITAMCK